MGNDIVVPTDCLPPFFDPSNPACPTDGWNYGLFFRILFFFMVFCSLSVLVNMLDFKVKRGWRWHYFFDSATVLPLLLSMAWTVNVFGVMSGYFLISAQVMRLLYLTFSGCVTCVYFVLSATWTHASSRVHRPLYRYQFIAAIISGVPLAILIIAASVFTHINRNNASRMSTINAIIHAIQAVLTGVVAVLVMFTRMRIQNKLQSAESLSTPEGTRNSRRLCRRIGRSMVSEILLFLLFVTLSTMSLTALSHTSLPLPVWVLFTCLFHVAPSLPAAIFPSFFDTSMFTEHAIEFFKPKLKVQVKLPQASNHLDPVARRGTITFIEVLEAADAVTKTARRSSMQPLSPAAAAGAGPRRGSLTPTPRDHSTPRHSDGPNSPRREPTDADDEEVKQAQARLDMESKELAKTFHLACDMARFWSSPPRNCADFFTFPNPTNSTDTKLHSLCTAFLLIASMCLDYFAGFPYLYFLPIYGFLARVLCGPRIDLQAHFVLFVLKPFLVDYLQIWEDELSPGPPKRFAQFCALIMTSTAVILRFVSTSTQPIAYWLLGAMLVMVFLQAVFEICLACAFFHILMLLGVLPRSVCVSCATQYEIQIGATCQASSARASLAGRTPLSPNTPRRRSLVADMIGSPRRSSLTPADGAAANAAHALDMPSTPRRPSSRRGSAPDIYAFPQPTGTLTPTHMHSQTPTHAQPQPQPLTPTHTQTQLQAAGLLLAQGMQQAAASSASRVSSSTPTSTPPLSARVLAPMPLLPVSSPSAPSAQAGGSARNTQKIDLPPPPPDDMSQVQEQNRTERERKRERKKRKEEE